MRNVFLLSIIIFLILLSCKEKNSLRKNEVIFIDGNLCKAIHLVTDNFYLHNFPIERYKIRITEDNDNYEIRFSPIIIDWHTASWGAQDFGNSVDYIVSKETIQIIKTTYGR